MMTSGNLIEFNIISDFYYLCLTNKSYISKHSFPSRLLSGRVKLKVE